MNSMYNALDSFIVLYKHFLFCEYAHYIIYDYKSIASVICESSTGNGASRNVKHLSKRNGAFYFCSSNEVVKFHLLDIVFIIWCNVLQRFEEIVRKCLTDFQYSLQWFFF